MSIGQVGFFAFCILALVATGCGGNSPNGGIEPGQDEEISVEPVPKPNPLIPNGAWSKTLTDSTHPRLIGPRDFLGKLAVEKGDLYDDIKSEIVLETASINTIVEAGIEHAVEGIGNDRIDPYIEEAEGYVQNGVTNDHQLPWMRLDHVAQTFDFFHDEIPVDKRKEMIDWCNDHLSVYVTDEWGFSQSIMAKILTYLRVAYATWGENPRAKEFRDHALIDLYEGKVVPVLIQLGAGGGLPEGGWYARVALWALVRALELARRIEGYDGFALAPKFFYQRLAYEMLHSYPTAINGLPFERYPMEGDGFEGVDEAPRLTRSVIAQYFRDSKLSRYTAANRREPSHVRTKVNDFLYLEGPDEPLDNADFPLSHLADSIGRIYARGSWEKDATWLRFECGDHYIGHQHLEVGNFEIYREEPLATESGYYDSYNSNHSVNWYIRTIAHNGILIYMPGEVWPMMRDNAMYKYENDGGQTTRWNFLHTEVEGWLANKDKYESGDIIAYTNRPEFLYTACDGTKAYDPEKVDKWTREILFLRPHTIVILDRIKGPDSTSYEKKWLLHSRYEPLINKDEYTIKGNKHNLYVKTLIPAAVKASKVYGYTYNGKTVDPEIAKRSDEENLWRIESKSSFQGRDEIFLHVISTEKMPNTEVEPVQLIDDDLVVRVEDIEILFSAMNDGNITIGDKSYSLPISLF